MVVEVVEAVVVEVVVGVEVVVVVGPSVVVVVGGTEVVVDEVVGEVVTAEFGAFAIGCPVSGEVQFDGGVDDPC